MKLLVSRQGADDVLRLRIFLKEKNPKIADRAVGTLLSAVNRLKFFPERGRPSGVRGIRELMVPFGQSAYVLRYAYNANDGEIVILRIWHGREAPE